MYLNRGLDYADLLHEGSFGLMKAAETFDYRLGNKFSSHAGILIKGAITHAIDKKSDTIRIPDNAQREMKTLRKFIAQYRSEHGRYPIEEEILDGTTFTPKALNRLQGAAKGTTSLDKSQSLGDGDDVTFGEFIERSNHDRSGLEDGKTSERPDEAHERNTRNSALMTAIEDLPQERWKEYLWMHYGLNGYEESSQTEIAEHFNVSKTAIQISLGKAKKRLRETLENRI